MRTIPEISLHSPFGKTLTQLAVHSRVIVEVGTGCGFGSTDCIYTGIGGNPICSFLTIEADLEQWKFAVKNTSTYHGLNSIYGCLHHTIRPFFHPNKAPQIKEMWDAENKLIQSTPIILASIPKSIDLLFLDGGEFTSDGDFLALWQRSKVIALDDCNPEMATKNVYAYECLSKSNDWAIAGEALQDRNGWAVFRRRD